MHRVTDMDRQGNLRATVYNPPRNRRQPGNNQPPRPQQQAARPAPAAEVSSLREELKAAKDQINVLSAENSRLREKNSTLERDNRLLDQRNDDLIHKLQTQGTSSRTEILALEQTLREATAGQDLFNKIIRGKDLEIHQLQLKLVDLQKEAGHTRDSFTMEQGQLIASLKAEVENVKAFCGTIAAQTDVISGLREDLKTFSEQVKSLSSQLELKQQDLDQNITRSKALEREFQDVLASREEGWRMKEEALLNKVSTTEEELRLAIIKSIGLQESALKGKKSKKEKRQKTKEVKEVKEAPLPLPEAGEEEEKVEVEKKKKKRGWGWGKKKRPSLSDSRVEEEAVCPSTSGQQ